MHELEFNLKLLEIFGIFEKVERGKVNFNLIVEENKKVDELIAPFVNEDKSIIIIHPGSGGSARGIQMIHPLGQGHVIVGFELDDVCFHEGILTCEIR